MAELRDFSLDELKQAVTAAEEQGQEVSSLTTEANLLDKFSEGIESAGLVQEADNSKIILLCALSARLDSPVSLTVQGNSSSGKNYIMESVTRFLPKEFFILKTGMSSKALMHLGSDEVKHKALFIAEYEGVKDADFSIRTLQSEGRIEWTFVDTTKSGLKAVTKITEGPVAFIQATTRNILHEENETRQLFIRADESPEQTKIIIRRQAINYMNGVKPGSEYYESVFKPWRVFFGNLKPMPIKIPFAQDIGADFAIDRLRSRRDFPKLMEMIKVSAFLHQNLREQKDGFLIVSNDDLNMVKPLFDYCMSQIPEQKIFILINAVKKIELEDGYKVSDLLEEMKMGRTSATEINRRAEEKGYVSEVEGRRGYYKLMSICRTTYKDLLIQSEQI
ncbi:hypothetical protein LCGC14_2187850 [marine sediment metagenome]|uniref:DNA primase n=1 Tax=marine sediment metagenome TaxID=412755 RepID=A0A0F9DKC1_9ZZZZ